MGLRALLLSLLLAPGTGLVNSPPRDGGADAQGLDCPMSRADAEARRLGAQPFGKSEEQRVLAREIAELRASVTALGELYDCAAALALAEEAAKGMARNGILLVALSRKVRAARPAVLPAQVARLEKMACRNNSPACGIVAQSFKAQFSETETWLRDQALFRLDKAVRMAAEAGIQADETSEAERLYHELMSLDGHPTTGPIPRERVR